MDKTPEQLAVAMFERAMVRFAKGFVAGFFAGAAVIQPPFGTSSHDLILWLHTVVVAGVGGGILAVEKLLSQLYGSQTNTITTQASPPQDPAKTTEVIPPVDTPPTA